MGSGLTGSHRQWSGPVSVFCLHYRRRLRRCIVCIRAPLSLPTLWWPCRSWAPSVRAPVQMRGPSTWCCCSYRRRRESQSSSRMGKRYASSAAHALTPGDKVMLTRLPAFLPGGGSALLVGAAVIWPCPSDCEVCPGATCQGLSCQRRRCWGVPADAEWTAALKQSGVLIPRSREVTTWAGCPQPPPWLALTAGKALVSVCFFKKRWFEGFWFGFWCVFFLLIMKLLTAQYPNYGKHRISPRRINEL